MRVNLFPFLFVGICISISESQRGPRFGRGSMGSPFPSKSKPNRGSSFGNGPRFGPNSRQLARSNSRRRTSPQLPRASTRQRPEIVIEFRNNGGQWQNNDVNSRFDKRNFNLDSRSQSRTGNRIDVAPSKDRWNNERLPQSNGQSRDRFSNDRFPQSNGQSRDRFSNDRLPESNGQSRDRFSNDRFPQSNGQSRDRFSNDRFPKSIGQSRDLFNNERVRQNNIGSHDVRQNTNQNGAFVDSHHRNVHDLSSGMSSQNHPQTNQNIEHDLHQQISGNHHLNSNSNMHHVTANHIGSGVSNHPQNGNLGSGPRNVNINSEILGLVNAVPLDQTVNHQSLSPNTALKPGIHGHTSQNGGLVGHSAINIGTHGNLGFSGQNGIHSGTNTHNLPNGVNIGPNGKGIATSGLSDLSAATSGHNVGLHENSIVAEVLGKQAIQNIQSSHGLNNVNGLSTGTIGQGTNLGSSFSNRHFQNSHNQMINNLSNAIASNQMLDLGKQQSQTSAMQVGHGQVNSQQQHQLATHLSNAVGQINTSLVSASTSTSGIRNNAGNGSAGFPGANNIDLNNTLESLNNIIASNASPGLSPVASRKTAAAHAHTGSGVHSVPAIVRPRVEPIEIDYEEILQRAMTNRILNGLII